MNEEIKCPFCGKRMYITPMLMPDDSYFYTGKCSGCRTETDTYPTAEEAETAAKQRADEWIKIDPKNKETLPKHPFAVIVCNLNHGYTDMAAYVNDEWHGNAMDVTHWMEKPKLPTNG